MRRQGNHAHKSKAINLRLSRYELRSASDLTRGLNNEGEADRLFGLSLSCVGVRISFLHICVFKDVTKGMVSKGDHLYGLVGSP